MSSSNNTDMVTLHLYSPPITGMIVYDLQKCAACVVSDDCGAWWPEEQYQRLKEIQLNKNAPIEE
jgi:cysteine dioxygenase